ncbi:MAG: tRNA lysidine(34) synthetase TilS [Clostridiaceae bacterium]|nr:tRNA lysidine(34) synthetase TilS [Clostridiaceae bacterium]
MQKRFLEFSEKYHMFREGERVVAAVSGGADSVCLLHLLAINREKLGIEVSALHVHHGLRGKEADRDAAYVEELCRRLKVPCRVIHEDAAQYAKAHGLSLEEAGREIRYREFDREADRTGAEAIAVAHHRDDNVETILHNLFRGSGLKGIGGIAPVRGRIVRPLLCFGREEILYYLEEKKIPYCTDSTNLTDDYTRNKLRNQIIPMIGELINPRAAENIDHAGKLIFQADEYLSSQAGKLLTEYGMTGEHRWGIPVQVLERQPSIIQTYVVFRMIKQAAGHAKDITSRHIEQVQELLLKETGSRTDLPYGLCARREYLNLWIEMRKKDHLVDKQPSVYLPEPVFTVFPYEKSSEIPKNRYTKWFDYDKIKGMVSVRIRETGDFITIPGGRKTVKAFMIDEKIPREERDHIPLLADGKHIIWIIGYRISEYYKVTDNTKNVLQVQLDGGKKSG